MADQKTLTTWILKNDERLDLRVKELSWIRGIFPGWFDLEVSVSVNGNRFVGRGSARNSDLALSKAFCEAIERSVCFANKIGSVGVAGHLSELAAAENARLECAERFAFSRAIESKEKLIQSAATSSIDFSKYRSLGISINFYEIPADSQTKVILCLANGLKCKTPFGGILGLAASANKQEAEEKAAIECLRSLEAYLTKLPSPISKFDFDRMEKPSGLDRQALLRDVDYFSALMESLSRAPSTEQKKFDGKFETLTVDPDFQECPLTFVRYIGDAPFVQPEFLG